MLDYIRIACAVPPVKVGNVAQNVYDICKYMEKADMQGADLVIFPELSLTGYTCGDLFFQDTLWQNVKAGVEEIVAASKLHPAMTVAVGLPVRLEGKLFNCACVIRNGNLCGIVPKMYIPNHGEFSERRWFASADEYVGAEIVANPFYACSSYVPFGSGLLFEVGEGAVLGVEICEDLFSLMPVSSQMCINGANVIVNLAASNETVGKRVFRERSVCGQSASANCIYAFCSSGYTESTSEIVFGGHSLITENGKILAENKNQFDTGYLLIQDCDLGRVQADRMKNSTFRQAASKFGGESSAVDVAANSALRSDGSLYPLRKLPFVPSTFEERKRRCMEIFQMQVMSLKQRLSAINANPVVGISGGLDSTLALLVSVEAMRQLGKPLSNVYGITMPCFGTSDRTYNNAWELMRTLGITAKEINIRGAVDRHYEDIGHNRTVYNATFENAQARERTQVLMDYAGMVNGIVVGTGDLSELALGWCTYNGDHMCMYGVNGAVPKTLIRWIVEAIAHHPDFAASKEVLLDVLDTPISPELLPPDAKGKISQQTEDLVGPYALHDFFLFYMIRYGFAPTKIYHLACRAFAEDFSTDTIKKWLKVFYSRFFTQQFKRNCMPDGIKIGSVGLSSHGEWKMASDVVGRIWLNEVESL